MAERNSLDGAGIKNLNLSVLFEELHNEAIQRNEEATKHWVKLRDEYSSLHARLAVLPDSLTQQVMVPIGSKALMRGSMVHTNEILVCLGDGWFVKQSAKQAAEICSRRIKVCVDFLDAVERERQLLSSRKDLPGQQDAFSTGEIVEPYDEVNEAQWRVGHREKEKAFRKKNAEERLRENSCESDEQMWKRFEELELQEELEEELSRLPPEAEDTEELQEEQLSENNDEGDNEDDDLTDELSDEFELVLPNISEDTGVRGGNGLIRSKVTVRTEDNRSSTVSESVPTPSAQRLENKELSESRSSHLLENKELSESRSSPTKDDQDVGDGHPLGRRVSFAGVDLDTDSDSSDEPMRIEFKHSSCGSLQTQGESSCIQTPADIYTHFKLQCAQEGPKSILKKKHNETRNIEVPLEESSEDFFPIFPTVFGEVLEHPSPELPIQLEAPEPSHSHPMSRFREIRLRLKR